MHRPLDRRLRARHDRGGPGRDGVGDKVLTIETDTLKGPEHRAARDLAVIDGEAGDDRVFAAGIVRAYQSAELHPASRPPRTWASSGSRSTSFVSLGSTPRMGAMRPTTWLTTGAAVQPAVA